MFAIHTCVVDCFTPKVWASWSFERFGTTRPTNTGYSVMAQKTWVFAMSVGEALYSKCAAVAVLWQRWRVASLARKQLQVNLAVGGEKVCNSCTTTAVLLWTFVSNWPAFTVTWCIYYKLSKLYQHWNCGYQPKLCTICYTIYLNSYVCNTLKTFERFHPTLLCM